MRYLIGFLALLCACTSSDQQASRLQLCLGYNPDSFDPRICGRLREQLVTKALFEGLVRIDRNGEPALATAKSLTISDDALTYTFTLKETVWSDGSPVTAHDFAYAWKSLVSPDSASAHAYYLYPLKNAEKATAGEIAVDQVGVTALDDHTLVVELAHPAPYFLELLANPIYSPVPRHAKPGEVSNGPFVIESWQPDRRLIMVKNPSYWDADAVQLEGIEISIIPDAITAYELFKKGQCDWAGDPFYPLPMEVMIQLATEGQLETLALNKEFHYVFDVNTAPFQSKKVRQAFAYAINRQQVTQTLPAGEVPCTSILPPGLTLHSHALFPDGKAPRAHSLFEEGLRELGLTRNDLKPIVLGYRQEEGQKRIAQIVQEQWQKVLGVTVHLEACDPGSYFAAVCSAKYPVAGFYWYSVFNDPSYNLNVFRENERGMMNLSRWQNSEFTTLLAVAESEADQKRRYDLYKRAEALVMEEMPAIPLFASSMAYVKSKRVSGIYTENTGYNTDFKWATVVEVGSK